MDTEAIRRIVISCARSSGAAPEIRFDEPMTAHTSFRAGGSADCWIKPGTDGFPDFAAALFAAARADNIPLFILGGGANILVSDKGIRGITLDTSAWTGEIKSAAENTLVVRSGTALDTAADIAADKELGGLEFFAGMPGTVGGALFMNARAYEQDTAGVLHETEIIDFTDEKIKQRVIKADKNDFAYKHSPFRNRPWFILSACFSLVPRAKEEIRARMETYRRDREDKGHYRYPSAGSAFKNNRGFGKPTGKIIDDLGMRGQRKGGAQIAPYHGNIVINTGGARAADIRALLEETAEKVKIKTGFVLEPEIIFAGDWN